MLIHMSTFSGNFNSSRAAHPSMQPHRVEREDVVATIRASCPTCGDVELTSGDVTVLICSTNNEGAYAFQCPACRLAVSKPAEGRVIDLLVSSGVQMSVWQLPAELHEPRNGKPIGYDDLLEFHFALQGDDWMTELTSALATDDER
ncbi:MAG: hypothetical protein QOG03_2529 [Actinomycetota bacterium]|nr:hypothetical protein [Actinomycetota bacterium]